ncbi:HupE/UreJ family protein [Ideonella sp. DXS22W]|uniref:HupE/UreJ family protein n=1 Tax=Pseudaquabacterium inlustre TaxID=2984192 RepID=A0ABU9CM34_9BURK
MDRLRRLGWVGLFGLLGAMSLLALPARAHKASDSYLAITVEPDGRVHGQWDIALRDLDHALGLDADGNGEITWGELRAQHGEIAAYALARLALSRDGQRCMLAAGPQQVDSHTDGAYTVLPLRIDCPAVPGGGPGDTLAMDYRLFADLDPQHRGLLRLRAGVLTRSAVFAPESARQSFALAAPGTLAQLLDHGREGVWHIWIGFDHILFLVSLLLPAVLVWQAGRWLPAPTFRGAFIDVLKIVSAFTLAHSLTLSAATLGWITLPSRLVESTIAASVVLAALNNLWPLAQGRRWLAAFGFGLIHGFGFASVLADLGLPGDALALALVGFNLGVELGQLAIVAVFLPLAFALRGTRLYHWGVLRAGSVLIALLAAVWFAERAFHLQLLA